MKKRRMDLAQREVARRIGANSWTVANWEKARTEPAPRFVAAITDFLAEPNHSLDLALRRLQRLKRPV